MLNKTRTVLTKKIKQYKKTNGITYEDSCPFPVSWKTVWSIVSGPKEQNFTRSTQKKLLTFFGLGFKRTGSDLVIIEKENDYDN